MPIKLVKGQTYLVASTEQSLHYYERLIGERVICSQYLYNSVEVRLIHNGERHIVFEEDLAEVATENCDYTFLLKRSML